VRYSLWSRNDDFPLIKIGAALWRPARIIPRNACDRASKLGARQRARVAPRLTGASDDADYLNTISPQKARGRPTRRWPATFRHFRHSRRCAAGISASAIEVSAGTFRTFR